MRRCMRPRHTTATLLRNAGVDQETRMKILGHSSATAHDAYVHVDQAYAREALSKLTDILSPS
jgi:integrase